MAYDYNICAEFSQFELEVTNNELLVNCLQAMFQELL